MSGDSAQRRRERKRLIVFFTKLNDVLKNNIQPMIREECVEEFNEIIDGLTETIAEIKLPQQATNERTGSWNEHPQMD